MLTSRPLPGASAPLAWGLVSLCLASCSSPAKESAVIETGPGELVPPSGTDSDTATTPTHTDTDTALDTSLPPPPLAVADADVSSGGVPLRVTFTAEYSLAEEPWTATWDFGDGEGAPDVLATHDFGLPGAYLVTLTVEDAYGRTDESYLAIAAYPATCPAALPAVEVGVLSDAAIDEASGIAVSSMNPGVLWTHNDSGGGPDLFAVAESGALLVTYAITGVDSRDWEDIALAVHPTTGVSEIYIGDVGDNASAREFVQVYVVEEPVVAPEPVEGEQPLAPSKVLTLRYPKVAHDSEAVMVDPLTADLYLVTKDRAGEGFTGVFRKPAPHADGDDAVMELVAALDFTVPPLVGMTVTGADIAPRGNYVVLRTYSTMGNLWLRGVDQTIGEAVQATPCAVTLPSETGLAESVGFTPDGMGLYTLAEGVGQPLRLTPLTTE